MLNSLEKLCFWEMVIVEVPAKRVRRLVNIEVTSNKHPLSYLNSGCCSDKKGSSLKTSCFLQDLLPKIQFMSILDGSMLLI